MKAVVLNHTCKAEELTISLVEIPKVKSGWVLIKVKAFGINHSEILFRSVEAGSPNIHLPRIMGIECVGEVADPSDSQFKTGEKVVALMGGMGRSFDGSYAEYALLPTKQVFSVQSTLSWTELGAIPETFFTAYGSLVDCLQINNSDTLLVRGGTSSLGIASIQLAKSFGATVIATSQHEGNLEWLQHIGADDAVVDDGELLKSINKTNTNPINKILELVGLKTLKDSLTLLAYHGTVCVTGNLGGKYTLDGFDPIKYIPNRKYLSSFFSNYPTQEKITELFHHIEHCGIHPHIGSVFAFEDIVKAHLQSESGKSKGKIVVTID